MKATAWTLISLVALSFGAIQLAQSPQDKVTLVREGALSQKQSEHSKLFAQHRTGRKLRDITASGTGEIVVTSTAPKPFIVGNSRCPTYPRPYLRNIAREADAIIIGTVIDKDYSQLTDNGEFIFSDYRVRAEDVIKNNASIPIVSTAEIIVTRPGGAVELNGRVVRGVTGNFKPFQVGERHLLFLKFVPKTASYVAFGNGSYALRNDKAISLFNALGVAQGKDVATLLNEVRAAYSAGPCGSSPRLY